MFYVRLFFDRKTKQTFYLNFKNNKIYTFKKQNEKKAKKNKVFIVPMGLSINFSYILEQLSASYAYTSMKLLFFCLFLGMVTVFASLFFIQKKQMKKIIKGQKIEVTLSASQIIFEMSQKLHHNNKKLPGLLLLILIYYFILNNQFNFLLLFLFLLVFSFLGMYLFQYYQFIRVKHFLKRT